MSKVAVLRCENYEYDTVKPVIENGIKLIGGIGQFVKSTEKILLKPNLLSADPPEKCVTTHPAIFRAVAELVKAAGATVTYGDSPAFQSPETAAKKAGLEQVASELGIKLADFKKGKEITYTEGRQNKKFTIANGVLDSDGVISLPKLKTHAIARMTGCIKNQFGCIPGTLKGEFHVRIPNPIDFCKMLVDLNAYINPRLYIMDGVYAMEGNGPRGGTPKKMNVILISSDPIALDATVCRLVNISPEFVPTIKFGYEAGIGKFEEKDIEIVGDGIESFIVKEFEAKREAVKAIKSGGIINFLRNTIVPKPVIDKGKCVKCGVCVKMCPVNPKAVDWHDGNKTKQPSYKYKNCIRCYCCQELCPESAIHVKTPLIRKIFTRKKSKKNN